MMCKCQGENIRIFGKKCGEIKGNGVFIIFVGYDAHIVPINP